MSRSKHTRPHEVLAAKRVRAPYEPRGKDDTSSLRRSSRQLKEAGIASTIESETRFAALHFPRIKVSRARGGHSHQISKQDIMDVLEFFGERCFYGLREINLRQGFENGGALQWGELQVPGTILIYDQPPSPWLIAGDMSDFDRNKLERAGATVEHRTMHNLVHWRATDLRSFMLFDVFMHEVGHHLIQQYKGKRNVRVARTKDHESFAELFARQCKVSYLEKTEKEFDA